MNHNVQEKVLLNGLIEGNTQIYDYLFHFYYSGLVAFAIRYVHEKDAAEDIVQDFFYKLWMNRENLRISKTIKVYFFTSIKNACLDHLRHEKVKDKARELILHQSQQEDLDESRLLVESELRDRINQAIDNLPDKCRQIFIMNRFEGLKASEIAEKENLSVRTIEGHIGKALKMLRTDLSPYLPAYMITLLFEQYL